MNFPALRLRRLRRTEALRAMTREAQLETRNLIAPLFIGEGHGVRLAIPSMPGVFRYSIDTAIEEAHALQACGIPAAILFGVPDEAKKDAVGQEAWAPSGIVQRALSELKKAAPELLLIADTCFCEYTAHGHCGVLGHDHSVDNDRTLENLVHTAVSQARAGAGMIAPSGMMDGMVQAIRSGLDAHGFAEIPIMAYSAKFSSAFYGPFRDAAASSPSFGDRTKYQMDPANARQALQETLLDVAEGADIVMVKPALAYLDIVAKVRERVQVPVAAYNVSGEYSMVKAAAANGWLDERRTALEIMTGLRRAGADLIITYWAKDLARWLKE